ncbi:hypothetical protein GSI_12553 [Ganoderma sinense ZZ0214-1]|uniref:DUF6533 domain-containing protein n=1 Tax=Ganoderma sinense ZZ0214-1 TaxID=1077348 RepID=A0A2G8RT32_9APHY|nr:hypothetical protein GSI_12553 [Ganoderma sinense ZZ0214-1]
MSSLPKAEFENLRITNDLQIAAAVLFLYDSVITIGDEMRFIWGRGLTGAIVLFYLNKYLLILYNTMLFVTFFQLSDEAADRRLVAGTVASSQELTRPNDSSLMFERIIGSLGASITVDDYIAEEYPDEDSGVEGGTRTEGVDSTEEEREA